MKNLEQAMNEEQLYLKDKFNGIATSLIDRLAPYGYDNLKEYFNDKKDYLFKQWKPKVYSIAIEDLTVGLEDAIQNEKYGIYISMAKGLYAFHGSDEIDYQQCEQDGVYVAELYHQGGTIIGNEEDLGIEIVAPIELGLEHNHIINKFYEIISRYEDNVEINGNDILVNGEKVLGSMVRHVGNAFVWAAQISFCDHSDVIQKVCKKQSKKRPGRLHNKDLTKDKLQKQVLKWLQKS